jgi:hypothetical protein
VISSVIYWGIVAVVAIVVASWVKSVFDNRFKG